MEVPKVHKQDPRDDDQWGASLHLFKQLWKYVGTAETTVRLRINLHNFKSVTKQLVNCIGKGFFSLFWSISAAYY